LTRVTAFDVAGRLAEGLAALDNSRTFVQACAARGYHHPDLTLHDRQIDDWYGTEGGLDLRALDADCVTLRSVSRQADEALQGLRAQLPALDAAWSGEGGSAAAEFVGRHTGTATQVATTTATAAVALERLRDELWRAVCDRADVTVAIDDRAASQRSTWLTAARAVLGGQTSEEAAAVVDTQIRPYVDSALGGEWVEAMRTSFGAVVAAYRAATDAVSSRPAVRFDIPGDLGPRVVRPVAMSPLAASPAAPVAAVPASALEQSAPAADFPNAGAPLAEPAPTPAPAVPAAAPAALPDPAAGAGGLPGQLADALGGLAGTGTSPLADLPGIPEPEAAAPPEPPSDTDGEEPVEPEPDDNLDQLRTKVLEAAEDVAVDEEVTAELGEPPAPEPQDCPPPAEPEKEVPPVAPEPPVTPPPVEPEPVAAAPDPAATPCEIAAEELPQVGE
jgi:hypothetical protein